MKYIYIIFLLSIICSCKSGTDFTNKKSLSIKVKDTLDLTGYLIYDKKKEVVNFYESSKIVDTDNSELILKKVRRKDIKYLYIEPYLVLRNFKKEKTCHMPNQAKYYMDTKNLIKNRFQIKFVDNESFLELRVDDYDSVISFKCW